MSQRAEQPSYDGCFVFNGGEDGRQYLVICDFCLPLGYLRHVQSIYLRLQNPRIVPDACILRGWNIGR